MATFEEKVLAYLDGSLSGAEREDVLHTAQASPQARALLNAHVRLGSLYALAAKPVSAPLALQRELASKVPVLAVKLPYLAMPEERRKRAAGWFWKLPSFRMNALLVLLAALLAGGIWFSLTRNGDGPATLSHFARPNTAGTSNPVTSNPGTSNREHSAQGTAPHSVPTVSSLAAAAPSGSHRSYGIHQSYRFSYGNHPTDRTKLFSKIPESNSPPSHFPRRVVSELPPPAARVGNDNRLPAGTLPVEAIPSDLHSADEFSPLELRSVRVVQAQAILPVADAAMPIPVLAPPSRNSYTRVRVFAGEDIRFLRFAPQTNPSEYARRQGVWQTSVTTDDPEFGIDYEITPWIALGARGGDARFIQEAQVSHTESLGTYEHVYRTVMETALLDPFAAWVCAAATFTPNPEAQLRYSFTAGAGDIFFGGFSPVVLGEAAASYPLRSNLALRASVSYQAAWTTIGSPVVEQSSQSNTVLTGYSVQSVPSKLYPSQSFGFSIGVAFQP